MDIGLIYLCDAIEIAIAIIFTIEILKANSLAFEQLRSPRSLFR
ncbi:hypothetical protein [Phormidium nigroviride]